MANFFQDNEDLRFYIDHWLDWDSVVELTEKAGGEGGFEDTESAVQFYKEILEMVGNFAADEIAPAARAIDETGTKMKDGEVVQPPEMDRLFEQMKQMQLHGLTVPRQLGGMNCPMAVWNVVTELFARADVSVMAHFGFHGGIAMTMLMYSLLEGSGTVDPDKGVITATRWDHYIKEVVEGRAWGSMDLTEPDAGSDLSALRTVAVEKDGKWFVTGNKIFITSGHGRFHFVLARTEDPSEGLGSLSLFLVPLTLDGEDGPIVNGYVDRVEDKLGHKGSATASVQFENSEAELVGERGKGFKQMLMMMNSARVSVGFESIGACESAYRMAKAYAAERKSMGKTIDKHELIADYLEEMETDIAGLRALAFFGGYHEEMARKLEIQFKLAPPADEVSKAALKKKMRFHQRKARQCTPLLKYLSAEKAVSMARMNMQIHGGTGYITEYEPERLLRDSLVMPIYEGTSQIQALMAMKDHLLGAIRDARGFVSKAAAARVRHRTARDPLVRRLAGMESNAFSAQQNLLMRIARRKWSWVSEKPLTQWAVGFMNDWDPKRDFAPGLLHAERLTKILADVAIAKALVKQAEAYPERRELAERYIERAEPRVRYLLDEITTTGDRLIERLAEEEPAEELSSMEAVG